MTGPHAGGEIVRREAGSLQAEEHEDALAARRPVDRLPLEVAADEIVDLDFALIERRETAIVGAEFICERHVVRERAAQSLIGRDAIVRIDLRAAAAHDLRGPRVRTDDGEGRAGLRGERQRAVVLQQHNAFSAGAADEGADFQPIVSPFRRDLRMVEGPHPVDQPQYAQRRLA